MSEITRAGMYCLGQESEVTYSMQGRRRRIMPVTTKSVSNYFIQWSVVMILEYVFQLIGYSSNLD